MAAAALEVKERVVVAREKLATAIKLGSVCPLSAEAFRLIRIVNRSAGTWSRRE